jgi:hypothetical protein
MVEMGDIEQLYIEGAGGHYCDTFLLEGCDFFYNFSDSEYLSWLPWKPTFATNIWQHFPSFLMTLLKNR